MNCDNDCFKAPTAWQQPLHTRFSGNPTCNPLVTASVLWTRRAGSPSLLGIWGGEGEEGLKGRCWGSVCKSKADKLPESQYPWIKEKQELAWPGFHSTQGGPGSQSHALSPDSAPASASACGSVHRLVCRHDLDVCLCPCVCVCLCPCVHRCSLK